MSITSTTPTLPLGIDIGSERIRIALARLRDDGRPELLAVATRARREDVAAVLADAVNELRTRERRCVIGVAEPDAGIYATTLPSMQRAELERAATFEAERFIDYPVAEATVRVVPIEAVDANCAIGVIRRSTLMRLKAVARAAKLRLVGIDNTAFALQRALPQVDAVLDVGRSASMLYLFGGSVPSAHRLPIGGAAFTEAIVHGLGIDAATAERRKHAHGIAGCGEDLRDRLVEAVANALVDARATGSGDVRSMALVGNGARLADLAAIVERATAVTVVLAALEPEISTTLPADVLRAAAPDWCQAYGLTLWAAA